MKKLFILSSLLTINFFYFLEGAQPTSLSAEQSRKAYVLPVHYDTNRKEWIALFGQYRDSNEWVLFQNNVYDDPWKFARIALHNLTNGLYNLDESRVPNHRLIPNVNRDFLYFAPVKYISAAELERNNQTISMKRFVWLPLDVVISSPQVRFKNTIYLIPREIQDAIKQYWKSDIEPRLQPEEEPEEPLIPRRRRPTTSAQGPSTSQAQSGIDNWIGIPDATYLDRETYEELSIRFNDGPSIKIDGQVWKTSAHYYEAQKFKRNPQMYERIKNARNARYAYELAKANKNLIDSDWNKRSIPTLLYIMRSIIENNPDLEDLLKETKNSIIIDDTDPLDDFYGVGPEGDGQNQLGQILMRIREELHEKGLVNSTYDYYSSPQDYFSRTNARFIDPKESLKNFGKALPVTDADRANMPGCPTAGTTAQVASSAGLGGNLYDLLTQLTQRLTDLLRVIES